MTSVPLATHTPRLTGYDRRLAIVTAALREDSKISEKAGTAMAVRILAALDHIPETVR
ncbi:DUF6307 family protein [Pseudonocardia xishanensis]|uniref:Uncharacterized protein n=1 Tax=Pseudonocardia xishanensis TaxID=630995 RepID=A0ABP8RHF8_9PSEU